MPIANRHSKALVRLAFACLLLSAPAGEVLAASGPSTWVKVDSPVPAMTGLWRRARGTGNLYDPEATPETQVDRAPYNAESLVH